MGRAVRVMFFAFLVATTCAAQDPPAPDGPPPGWREETDALRKRLDELERRLAEVAPVATGTGAAGSPDDGGGDLDRLMAEEKSNPDLGSFGFRLTQYGIDPYVHGYMTQSFLNLNPHRYPITTGVDVELPNTFFLSQFAVIVGANIKDIVVPEVQLVYETNLDGDQDFDLRYGQVDIHLDDLLTIRAGKFLVPFGRYNEYLYPEFLFPFNRGVLASFVQLVPVVWADTGAQVRGRYRVHEDLEFNYSAYIVNGLEQRDDPTTPQVDDGGSISRMRDNDFEIGDGNKSFGGRVGVKAWGVEAGLSVYGGPYTDDGKQSLYLYGYYFYFQHKGFSLGSEGVLVDQERQDRTTLHRRGGFVYVAYRFFEVPLPVGKKTIDIEPVLGLDLIAPDQLREDNARLYLSGLQFYFLPKDLPNAKLAFTFGWRDNNGHETHLNVFTIDLSLAF